MGRSSTTGARSGHGPPQGAGSSQMMQQQMRRTFHSSYLNHQGGGGSSSSSGGRGGSGHGQTTGSVHQPGDAAPRPNGASSSMGFHSSGGFGGSDMRGSF